MLQAAERQPVTPKDAPAPVGPYSPGIQVGDYLYVSGQGARNSKNELPATPEGQAAQTLENVRAIVEAAGLTMGHVVYMQMYLANLDHRAALEQAVSKAFPGAKPATSLVAVHRMPTNTPVEISAVAVRDAKSVRRSEAVVTTSHRLYVAGQLDTGVEGVVGKLRRAGLAARNALALTAYHTPGVDAAALEDALQKSFAAAITVVQVPALPDGAAIEVTGIAARIARDKKTEGQPVRCTAANGLAWCAASAAPTAGDTGAQTMALLGSLEPALKALGSGLSQAVVNHVYLDELDEFAVMNKAYATRFTAPYPTRTTVQPGASKGGAAPRVRVSVIGVAN